WTNGPSGWQSMMDDERIEQALRAGPPDETAYEGGAFDPALAARASASRYPARGRNGRSGLFRIAATTMAAVFVVIGLLVVRSGNRTPELPAASEQRPSASPGLVSPTPSALASPTT